MLSIPDDFLTQILLRDLPTTAIVLVVVFAGTKYLDRWLAKFAAAQDAAALTRQKEILILLEKLGLAYSTTDAKLQEVIERDSACLDSVAKTLLATAENMGRLTQAQTDTAMVLRDMAYVMNEHYKDVYERPCQQQPPTRPLPRGKGRPSVVGSGD